MSEVRAMPGLPDVNDDAAAPNEVTAFLLASQALVAIAARSLDDLQDDLTLPQFRALVVLDTGGPTTVSAVADRVGVHQATASRILRRLVKDKLVTRSTNRDDRREVLVALAPRGSDLVTAIRDRRRAYIATVLERMPPNERQQAVSALQSFSAAVGEPSTPDPWI